jgi:dTDP-4-dehydrorhamnose 3,5-epimerase
VAIELDSQEQIALWVPEGFAHGFQSLESETRVLYKVTNVWNKLAEMSLNPIDNDLGIKWPQDSYILSEKDRLSPNLVEVRG